MSIKSLTVTLLMGALFATGCSDSKPSALIVAQPSASRYVVSNEPTGAIPVGTARESVANDEDVVLIGHIGGSVEPFIDGMAAFTIVDPKVAYCAAAEGCATPWDYCCEQNEVKKNIAMIKVVDSEGSLVPRDAKSLLGVKELALVVVRGKAQRDDEGNLSLLATQVYVKSNGK